MKGKLLIFSAPSGSGKSTVVQHLMKQELGLAFSISATSRDPRPHEKEGIEYYFLSPEEFRDQVSKQAFVEWEEVYPGQYYGTLKSELERIWGKGQHALFDIDVMGGINLKRQYGDRAFSIFVKPPSMEELERRLRARETEDAQSLRKRLEKAEYEMQFAPEFDHILINNQLDTALKEAERVVKNFLNQ
jgi:guanylate kinase